MSRCILFRMALNRLAHKSAKNMLYGCYINWRIFSTSTGVLTYILRLYYNHYVSSTVIKKCHDTLPLKGQSHQMDIFLEIYEINSVLSICALISLMIFFNSILSWNARKICKVVHFIGGFLLILSGYSRLSVGVFQHKFVVLGSLQRKTKFVFEQYILKITEWLFSYVFSINIYLLRHALYYRRDMDMICCVWGSVSLSNPQIP